MEYLQQVINELYKKLEGNGDIGQILLEDITTLKKVVGNHADVIRNILDVQQEIENKKVNNDTKIEDVKPE
jgi:hypothetical protein